MTAGEDDDGNPIACAACRQWPCRCLPEKDLKRRRRAAPIEGNAQLLLQLAERCEQEQPNLELNYLIFLAAHPSWIDTRPRNKHGVLTGQLIAYQDSPRLALRAEGMAAYTTSLDAASTLSGWALIHASDIGADGLPYVVLTDGTHEAKGVAGRNLTLTWCAAALRARAKEAEGSVTTGEQAERSEDAPTPTGDS